MKGDQLLKMNININNKQENMENWKKLKVSSFACTCATIGKKTPEAFIFSQKCF